MAVRSANGTESPGRRLARLKEDLGLNDRGSGQHSTDPSSLSRLCVEGAVYVTLQKKFTSRLIGALIGSMIQKLT